MKRKKRKRAGRVRRTAVNIIMICLAAIVLLSGWKIYTILHDYSTNQGIYDDLSDQNVSRSGSGLPDIDFDSLREINPDIAGWLIYEGTQIDYPVVRGVDNDKYLHMMFNGTYSGFGCLFADAETIAPFRQFNTIIYGHHMLNGSMFGDLKNLTDKEFCREHPELLLLTPDGNYRLRICAFLNQPDSSDIYTNNISDPDEKEAYLNMIRGHAEYITSEEMNADSDYVILSTCAYEYQNARYILVTKMIPYE